MSQTSGALGTEAKQTVPRATGRALLQVSGVSIAFGRPGPGAIRVVNDLSYHIDTGETLGVVGESGCGKSMTALALIGLVPPGGRVQGGITLDGQRLNDLSARAWRGIRGRELAMIFQEPMTAMNPVMPVGRQVGEVLVRHENLSWRDAQDRAVELLTAVGIPSAARRARDFPHQLSGGMRQRAMIAMALACRPKLLIADEPTTALDVTIQAQILDLMLELQEETGMAIQFISHNLAVISEVSHKILVMYAGRPVEYAPADDLFEAPRHPYTRGLIATLPDPKRPVDRLSVIPGSIALMPRQGCRFAPRCPLADDACRASEPAFAQVAPGHFAACFKVAS